jgi:BMFP domain-containing protein YqiC
MAGENPFLDHLARLLTDAAGAAEGLRNEIDVFVKARLEKLAADMNFVPRDEFDAVKAMAVSALAENEALKARLDALEKRLST